MSKQWKGEGKPYFEGMFTDGKKNVHFVGFNSDQRESIEELKSKSVELNDCAVKKQKYSDELEVVVSDKTDIAECAKEITVDADFMSGKTIITEQIGIFNAGDEVQLVGKVLRRCHCSD